MPEGRGMPAISLKILLYAILALGCTGGFRYLGQVLG
jgi:hypothetical protein